MKILVLAELDKWNSFKQSLNFILNEQGFDTVFSLSKFWTSENEDFDIVFFHWEEYLAKGKDTDTSFLEQLEKRMLYWKKRSKLVILKHNLNVHTPLGNSEQIFEIVNKYQDGVIHMGEYSRREYTKMYSFSEDKKHVIIPHQWYIDTPNEVDKYAARKVLGIDNNKFVMLVFGAVRKKDEADLILKSFSLLNADNKLLLVSSWRGEKKINKKRYPLKWSLLKIRNILYRFNSELKLNQSFVAESEVQNYFSASDMLFIPRTDSLNSGNIPLGFTFKKVVVGPNIGNMGEILSNTGNPTFEVNSQGSIEEAINLGYKLSQTNKGLENYEYAAKNWDYDSVGVLYKQFFYSLIKE